MARRRANGQRGFVITLELVLIFTILGIGLLVGLVAIRNALVVWWAKKQAQTVWVYDSSSPAKVLGPVRDFDEHEAPRLFYIDRDVTWCVPFGAVDCTDVVRNYRAFIGVRDDRFTTRPRVFYSELGCTGTPCLPDVSNEDADNLGIGFLSINIDSNNDGTIDSSTTSRVQNAGGVGYLYALQRGPNYGVGADIDQTFNALRLPGTLYRQTANQCLAGDAQIRSVWTSQEVVTGEPCLNLPDGLVVESAKCPPGQDGDNAGDPCETSPNVDPRCVTGGNCVGGSNSGLGCFDDSQCPGGTCSINPPTNADLICSCPVGWSNGTGSNCCPPGSTETAPGQCEIGTTGVFFEATPVQLAGENAFANLTPPFRVNLPPDTSSFVTIAPGGFEGAPAGAVTGTYTGEVDFDFNVPASGQEGGPP
jgi:hypothetical protein